MDIEDALTVASVRKALKRGFGEVIRVESGLTRAEVGAVIGKSGMEYGRYEKGAASPPPKTALAIGDLWAGLLEAPV